MQRSAEENPRWGKSKVQRPIGGTCPGVFRMECLENQLRRVRGEVEEISRSGVLWALSGARL